MIYYGNNDYRDYLAHYGVLGMHWGIRRYQPYSYTEGRDGVRKGKEMGAARKLGDTMKRAGSAVSRTAKSLSVKAGQSAKAFANKQKERIKESREARKERKKEKLINSGDIDKVYKNRSKLTNDELKRATDRIVAEGRLRDLQSEESMKSIERGKRVLATVADMTRNIGSIYDTVSGIKNKMETANIDAAKRASNKLQDEKIKSGDYDTISKAIANKELDADHIKAGKEIMISMKLMREAKEAEDTSRRHAREDEILGRGNANEIREAAKNNKIGADRYETIDKILTTREKLDKTSASSENQNEYKSIQEDTKRQARSAAGKKAAETRKRNAEAKRKEMMAELQKESEAKIKERQEQGEAIASAELEKLRKRGFMV